MNARESYHRRIVKNSPKGNDDLYSGSIGLFIPDNVDGQAEENRFEEELKRRNKKKKQRKIRF